MPKKIVLVYSVRPPAAAAQEGGGRSQRDHSRSVSVGSGRCEYTFKSDSASKLAGSNDASLTTDRPRPRALSAFGRHGSSRW